MAPRCTHEKASFLSLDGLDNIPILLDEDNDLEEEIIHLFNEISILVFKFEKKTTNQGVNIIKICTVIRVTSNDFKYVF